MKRPTKTLLATVIATVLPLSFAHSVYAESISGSASSTIPVLPDWDFDGVLNENDAFPHHAEASLDGDGDGYPDAWHASCDTECQANSSLKLDAFPGDASVALDNDGNGKPDQWNLTCDDACKAGSAWADQLDRIAPVITNPPNKIQMTAAQSMFSEPVQVDPTGIVATDNIDASQSILITTLNQQMTHFLGVGRHEVPWVAIDSAGNVSLSANQVVEIYPEVGFNQPGPIHFAGYPSLLRLELANLSRVSQFPITLKFSIDEHPDSLPRGLVDVSEEALTLTIDNEEAARLAALELKINKPVGQFAETRFRVSIDSVLAGEGDDPYAVKVTESRKAVDVQVTDENIAPQVSLNAWQDEQKMEIAFKDKGAFSVRADVYELNGEDTHTFTWTLNRNYSSTPVKSLENVTTSELTLDPADLETGHYTARVEVKDSGIPQKGAVGTVNFYVLEDSANPTNPFATSSSPSSASSSSLAAAYIYDIWESFSSESSRSSSSAAVSSSSGQSVSSAQQSSAVSSARTNKSGGGAFGGAMLIMLGLFACLRRKSSKGSV